MPRIQSKLGQSQTTGPSFKFLGCHVSFGRDHLCIFRHIHHVAAPRVAGSNHTLTLTILLLYRELQVSFRLISSHSNRRSSLTFVCLGFNPNYVKSQTTGPSFKLLGCHVSFGRLCILRHIHHVAAPRVAGSNHTLTLTILLLYRELQVLFRLISSHFVSFQHSPTPV